MSKIDIRSKHYTIEMEVPGESPWKGSTFYEKYDLLENAYYRLDDQSPNRIYKGSKTNQKCSICSKTSSDVSFKAVSHLLPEALGNNKYISNEECDSCNDFYSTKFEGALATMFGFYRVFRGVRGKIKVSKDANGNKIVRRIPKIKISDSEEIRFDEINQTVTLTSDFSDASSILKSDSHLEIKAPVEKHQPAKGIMSLIKSAWLLLDEDQRQKYPEIIQVLKNTDNATAFNYFSAFFPGGGFPLVELSVYGVKDNIENLPKVIITFTFANNMLIWNSCKDAFSVFPPVYLPIMHAKDMSCTLKKHELPNIDYEVSEKVETHHIQFDSMIKSETGEVKSKIRKDRERISYPVGKVKLAKDGVDLSTEITVFRFDCECTSFKISGGEFGGVIAYEEFKNFNKINSKLDFSLPSVSIDSALRTILFFKDLTSVNAKFSILGDPDGETIYTVDNFQINFFNDGSLEKWLEICHMVKVVNLEFSHNLRFPHKISGSEIRSLRILTDAILKGQSQQDYVTPVTLKTNCKFQVAQHVIDVVNKGQKIEVNNQVEFHVMNKVFGPFDQVSWLQKPTIKVNGIPSTDILPTHSSDEVIVLEVECYSVINRYPKWTNPDIAQ